MLSAFAKGNVATVNDNERWTQYLRVRAFKLSFRESEPSILDIDGERISKKDLYVESIPDALAFFTMNGERSISLNSVVGQ
jgi:diacylglycerol kinase family enzyme